MNIESVKLVCFSPTGTTKAVLQGIARGTNHGNVELLDITTPEARKEPLHTSEDELLVIGVPVYMGRVPALITEWLNEIQAHNTPTVCVVLYGNRVYEDALLELKNIVMKCGGIPIAGGAYVGEHSFSNADTPIAEGRPNDDDLQHAEEFGRKIRERLQSVSSVSELSEVMVPGMYPYRGDSTLWKVDFIEVNDRCIQCGVCAEGCPVGAVDRQNSSVINQETCITCCACIKNCPKHARTMKPGMVHEASLRLSTLYHEPKTPEYYLS
ncbi:MAG: EFR1 family ferrodoxin [Methanospirillum sp.]|uniref:EFR1 family ferrodoxin n=1 Tax=Methanospirillum sp. TaxID=45200 RepID=UPI0023710AE2|nr:EFR1 family ferrodoxin [Methanospirillum sp.]MDD1730155.1 EFR1 family ferrodoxin [Methanospirillum sp.]